MGNSICITKPKCKYCGSVCIICDPKPRGYYYTLTFIKDAFICIEHRPEKIWQNNNDYGRCLVCTKLLCIEDIFKCPFTGKWLSKEIFNEYKNKVSINIINLISNKHLVSIILEYVYNYSDKQLEYNKIIDEVRKKKELRSYRTMFIHNKISYE
jgi:hypothetical protein